MAIEIGSRSNRQADGEAPVIADSKQGLRLSALSRKGGRFRGRWMLCQMVNLINVYMTSICSDASGKY